MPFNRLSKPALQALVAKFQCEADVGVYVGGEVTQVVPRPSAKSVMARKKRLLAAYRAKVPGLELPSLSLSATPPPTPVPQSSPSPSLCIPDLKCFTSPQPPCVPDPCSPECEKKVEEEQECQPVCPAAPARSPRKRRRRRRCPPKRIVKPQLP